MIGLCCGRDGDEGGDVGLDDIGCEDGGCGDDNDNFCSLFPATSPVMKKSSPKPNGIRSSVLSGRSALENSLETGIISEKSFPLDNGLNSCGLNSSNFFRGSCAIEFTSSRGKIVDGNLFEIVSPSFKNSSFGGKLFNVSVRGCVEYVDCKGWFICGCTCNGELFVKCTLGGE